MTGFLEEVGRAVRSSVCSILGSATDGVSMINSGLSVPLPTIAPAVRAARRQLCDNNDDTVTLPPPPPPEDCHDGQEYPGGMRINFSTLGNFPQCIRKYEINSFNPNQNIWNITITNCNGSTTTTNVQNIQPLSTGCCNGENNPLPDCEPGPIPPYVPTPQTVTINYENNQQITVNEDVDITIFSPQLNLIGGIFAPVVIAGNTFQLAGTVQITPEFKLEINPEINIGTGGGNTDNPAPDPDRPIPEPAPDNSERRVIVGAVVTATAVAGRQDFIPQGENPDIAVPNLGYIAFYIATENARAWTADIPVKNVRTYIACPVASGATNVAGTGRSGIELSVQPVWGYPSQHLRAV